MKKPEKWTNKYSGEEEYKFFKSLARNPKYEWRSTSGIAKEAGLSKERVEEIIKKYLKKGMIFQNSKNEDLWAYWENVQDLLPKGDKSISKTDHDKRIDKIISTEIIINKPFPGCKLGYNVDERWNPPSEDEIMPRDSVEALPPWNTGENQSDIDHSIKYSGLF